MTCPHRPLFTAGEVRASLARHPPAPIARLLHAYLDRHYPSPAPAPEPGLHPNQEQHVTKLDDLFDLQDLEKAIAAGHVRTQTRPGLPYVIHNYTELAQFERAWTPVTRQCRGLIAHADTREILARPFPKTHNHNEPDAPAFRLDEPVIVADKVDGSLGILYPLGNGGHNVATRGSFSSDQALHATAVYASRYADHVRVPTGVTPLFEIVYPANRIVVDYGDFDDLVLLGGVEIADGEFIVPDAMASLMRWPGPVAESFPLATFGDVLASAPRPGKEGYIIRSAETGAAVKFKYDEYVRLHKIVTGLNARGVWELLGTGKTPADICVDLPDEFHPWVREVAAELTGQANGMVSAATATHQSIVGQLPAGFGRRDYAEIAKQSPISGYLFRLLDGRDVFPQAWKDARPAADWTPAGKGRSFDEANA